MSDSVRKPIQVTQPALPDLDDYCRLIGEIWSSGRLTNNGQKVVRLEEKLTGFLGAKELSVFANGTIALQIACRLLNLTGEVITTPFTFPATVNALVLNQATPVFCDIDENTLNIDAGKLESLITDKTTGILPVHVFGNPCDVFKIQAIADKYGLKILYDAAHAFGVKYKDAHIAEFGDITMFSFHATKVFNTIEGGALAFNRPGLRERAEQMRNFGILEDGDIEEPGINGKMNEVQAAAGLLLLGTIKDEINARREISGVYGEMLGDVPGIRVHKPIDGVLYNYPYMIIMIDKNEFGLSRDELYETLKASNIITRKYFYPLCSNLRCYGNLATSDRSDLPIANKISDSVLALPLYGNLAIDDVRLICRTIRRSAKQ